MGEFLFTSEDANIGELLLAGKGNRDGRRNPSLRGDLPGDE
jgi:hypothetical protein